MLALSCPCLASIVPLTAFLFVCLVGSHIVCFNQVLASVVFVHEASCSMLALAVEPQSSLLQAHGCSICLAYCCLAYFHCFC